MSILEPSNDLTEVLSARTRRTALFRDNKTKQDILRTYVGSQFYRDENGNFRDPDPIFASEDVNYAVRRIDLPIIFSKSGKLDRLFTLQRRSEQTARFGLQSIKLSGIEVVSDPTGAAFSTVATNRRIEHQITPSVKIATLPGSETAMSWCFIPKCTSFVIVEAIELCGLAVRNKLNGTIYVPEQGGRYIFIDEATKEYVFAIGTPLVEDANCTGVGGVEHRLEIVGGKLLYTKYSTTKTSLGTVVWPLAIDAMIFTGDELTGKGYGNGRSTASTSWATVRNATQANDWFAVNYGLSSNNYAIGGGFRLTRSCCAFDTTAIGVDATVDTVTIHSCQLLTAWDYAKYDADMHVVRGTFVATDVQTLNFFNDFTIGSYYGDIADFARDSGAGALVHGDLNVAAVEKAAWTRLFFLNERDYHNLQIGSNDLWMCSMASPSLTIDETYPTKVYLEIAGNFEGGSSSVTDPNHLWSFRGTSRRHRIRR